MEKPITLYVTVRVDFGAEVSLEDAVSEAYNIAIGITDSIESYDVCGVTDSEGNDY
jgi:hypothetical protein